MQDDPFAVIRMAAEEVYHGPAYRWDNSGREGPDRLVVQLTVEGAAFIETPAGRSLAPAGAALLFTHREDSVYGYPPEATGPYRLRYLSADPSPLLRPLFAALRAAFGPVVRLPPGAPAALRFADLYERHRRHAFLDRAEQTEAFFGLLTALYREQLDRRRAADPVENGWHLLRDRFREPLNLKQVAAACGVSREHFARAFRARYGEAPAAWLRQLRLEQARTLLAATRLPLAEIARASGFPSAEALRRACRAAGGDGAASGLRPARPESPPPPGAAAPAGPP